MIRALDVSAQRLHGQGMGRSPRIQFEGACYHVANRGRSGADVFGTVAAAQTFVSSLHDACVEAGWRLHAYALLPNEFHLALTTPRGNLAEGMHWLQGTCAGRLGTRGCGATGRVFGGRYRSRLLEPGPELARWVAEIHLAPVRAGLVTFDQLPAFRWSSFRVYPRLDRPPHLDAKGWLAASGGLRDAADGWRKYREYLARFLAADGGAGVNLAGPVEGRRGPARPPLREGSVAARAASVALHGRELAELREPRWIAALDRLLAEQGRTIEQALAAPKGAPWKVALAASLRRETTVTNAWLARVLGMGSANAVSVHLSRWRKAGATWMSRSSAE